MKSADTSEVEEERKLIMSKVGKQPIKIPEGVTVDLKDNQVAVVGPKGKLEQKIRLEIEVKKSGEQILVLAKSKSKLSRSLHGLTRTLISNMIEGVTKGFEKTLELHGVGYRVFLEEGGLKISVGFSHPVIIKPVKGITYETEGDNVIKVLGIDKQLVGQIAAKIREVKKPEPYKGKGIRYQGEVVKKKPGKAAKTEAAGT